MTRPGDELFRTRPADAVVAPSGWVTLPSALECTREPLIDATSGTPGLYARLSQADAGPACAAVGGRLPTREEVIEILDASHLFPPVLLPADHLMASRRRCEEHDATTRTMMRDGVKASPAWPATPPWDGDRPLGNTTKRRIHVPGMNPSMDEAICGWRKRDGSLWQQGVGVIKAHHGPGAAVRVDYGTGVVAVRDAAGISMPPDPIHTTPDGSTPAGSTPPPLRLRALAAAREHLARRIREAPGKAIDPQVSAYLGSCRRGGTSAAGILDLTGSPLGLLDDATAWCAAFASWCLAVSGPTLGEVVPHGYRISVAELVQDAKARSCWRGPTERPELGWLAIWTRAGGDPLRGGTGHVGRVSRLEVETYRTIEGNHGDAVAEVAHRYDEPSLRGWVAYP